MIVDYETSCERGFTSKIWLETPRPKIPYGTWMHVRKKLLCSLIKTGNMGSFGFGYRAGPCFLAVKSMKNPVFFTHEENSEKTIKSVLENHYFQCQISLNHA